MKKLFTLLALLACFMGAKADWVTDYEIDYSTKSNFPFYVMGFVPEWVDGVMTDYGSDYRYATQADLDGDGDGKWKDGESSVGTAMADKTEYQKVTGAGPYWHQYFVADGVPTELDGSYTVKAMIKASEEINLELQMGWDQWWTGTCVTATAKVGTEWTEVEWEFTGIGGTSCNIDAKPGNSTATIEWKWLKVSHNAKDQKPTEWLELITADGTPEGKWMGDAETPWGDLANTKYNDLEETNGRPNTTYVSAWGKEKGVNMNENNGWDPFPATIATDPDDEKNHVFVVHGKLADTEGDASAWDNQFWIMSTKELKVGTQYKFHFRYKASEAAKTNTQMHSAQPSDYLHYAVLGDINFTTTWQEFDKVVAIPEPQNKKPIYSIAFNLNPENKNAIDFYFDDLSIQEMKLEKGLFVAGSNSATGLEYDFGNAIEFTYDEEAEAYTATIGTVGKKETWVSEVMISTIRGNDAAFKANTIKPSSSDFIGEDNWPSYEAASLAKIKVAAGVYTISIDTKNTQINFVQLEGEAQKEPVDIVTNPEVLVIKGVERQPTKDEQPANPDAGIEEGTGNTWDNQFFIVANRVLEAGEETVVEFDYVANVEANTYSSIQAQPGQWKGGAFDPIQFTTTEQHFSKPLNIPSNQNEIQSIAFDMAVIKGACDYTIKNVKWYLKNDTEGKTMENLIDATGTKNFKVKIGAGKAIVDWGTETGISEVVNKVNTGSAVIYNLAGQRVSKSYKGIVVKNGKKVVVK